MRRARILLLMLFAMLALVRPGNGCSFSDDYDLPSHVDPDKPYSAYVAGRLGIVSGDLRVRHMVVAYNYLSGRGLTTEEQKGAIDVDRFYNYGDPYRDVTPAQNAAAMNWSALAPNTPTQVEHSVPGQNYSSFTNCLEDAFVKAAATLVDRRAKYNRPGGQDSPEVQEWIAGQEAVFSNCSDQAPEPNFRPGGQQPPPRAPATLPKAVAASAPLWLKQDRAYQIAAAHFYALDYDDALQEFRAIATDKASPWAQLSRYVVARVLIRRAAVPFQYTGGASGEADAARARVLKGLTEARDQLQDILKDPAMKEYQQPSQHLLDYVMVRLDPASQADELARRLARPAKSEAEYRQNVIDLTFAYNSLPFYSLPVARPGGGRVEVKPQAPLTRWIADVSPGFSPDMGESLSQIQNPDAAAHGSDALAAWRTTKQTPWLAAALVDAQPGGEGVAEMVAAAKAVPSGSPAYATVTYHRLRLAGTGAGRYDELARLMPEIERTQPRSAINQFADLRSNVAPTLEAFLKTATRVLPISIQNEPGEGYPDTNGAYGFSGSPEVTLCGVSVAGPDTQHLDPETQVVFNQRMPLRVLRQAALSPDLPGNVRFTVAHMAWTRALLLDDAETARALGPYLAQCQPAFKTWLDQYAVAKTPEERHVAGLMAMMRFTSTSPVVEAWGEHDFAAYTGRDVWWCAEDRSGVTPLDGAKTPLLFGLPLIPRAGAGGDATGQPDPPFLSAADRAEADKEIAALEKIPGASDYFAQQTLDWVKAHPDDAHNADLVGFAFRVGRNACRSDKTAAFQHQLFDTMHQRFPKSEWALRYKTWE